MNMNKIAVIGAGTMGNGIAHVFAQKGFEVHIIDTQKTALDKAMLIGGVIGHRVVNRAHVVPHQHITDCPKVAIAKLWLQLVLK